MRAPTEPNLSVASARVFRSKPSSRNLRRLFLFAIACVFLYLSGSVAFAQSINDQPPAHINPPPIPQLDVNHATVAQLMKIPGITQIYAQRIVAGRPYTTKGQLKTSGILPPELYRTTKDHLVAHRPKK
jgi:predicted DNA-binding helix-hairpin-helix protein